jgi:ribosomal protein S27AE
MMNCRTCSYKERFKSLSNVDYLIEEKRHFCPMCQKESLMQEHNCKSDYGYMPGDKIIECVECHNYIKYELLHYSKIEFYFDEIALIINLSDKTSFIFVRDKLALALDYMLDTSKTISLKSKLEIMLAFS